MPTGLEIQACFFADFFSPLSSTSCFYYLWRGSNPTTHPSSLPPFSHMEPGLLSGAGGTMGGELRRQEGTAASSLCWIGKIKQLNSCWCYMLGAISPKEAEAQLLPGQGSLKSHGLAVR